MGTRKGWLGASVLPFAVFIAIARRLRPAVILHECTRMFRWRIFCSSEEDGGTEIFPGYSVHHMLTNPVDFGWPVQRSRSYTAIIRSDWELANDLSQIYRLFILPGPSLDAGAFLADETAEAALPSCGCGL